MCARPAGSLEEEHVRVWTCTPSSESKLQRNLGISTLMNRYRPYLKLKFWLFTKNE